ncbi:MAG: glycosyl hydrolase family 8 [Pseudomonadota bacterium]
MRTTLVAAATMAACMSFAAPPVKNPSLYPYGVAVAYNATLNNATVSWRADAPLATGFGVERRPVGKLEWSQVAYLGEPARSHLDPGLAPLTRYEYRVKAYRPGGPAEGYASATTATTALNFPYAVGYGRGIGPTNYTQAQQNADTRAMYSAWRAKYVTTSGAGTGGVRVYKPTEGGDTVSEGMGFGMLISVYMATNAAGDPSKGDFDGMLTYYKAKEKRVNGINYGLMNWRVAADGSIIDPYVAPDGDIDVAFALLVADKKWGSAGAINYKLEAVKILNALLAWTVLDRAPSDSKLINKGDMANLTRLETSVDYTMSSYQIVSYFKQFANASDAAAAGRWLGVMGAGYKLYDYFYKLNPGTALTPFTSYTQPGPNQYQQTTRGYNYGYDASRLPWRVGLDYLWHGNDNSAYAQTIYPGLNPNLAHDMPVRNVQWFDVATGGSLGVTTGNPQLAKTSYELHGGVSPGAVNQGQRSMVGAMAVGAMTDPVNQAWLNRAYEWMRVQVPGASYANSGVTLTPAYYSDTVMMVCMIAVTGNMPNLPSVPVP